MTRNIVAVVALTSFLIATLVGAVFLFAYVGDSGIDPWPGARR